MREKHIHLDEYIKMLLRHELSHYLFCEISRRINNGFSKPTEIQVDLENLQNSKKTVYVKMACYPNNITEKLRANPEISKEKIEDLEKEFFYKNEEMLYLTTLQLACGYISNIFFDFDNKDYFIDTYTGSKVDTTWVLRFYSIEEELKKGEMRSDFGCIKRYWGNQLENNEWRIIIEHTKKVLENSEFESIMKECMGFCLKLRKDNKIIVEGNNLSKLNDLVSNLLSKQFIEFYEENLTSFINTLPRKSPDLLA